VKKKIPPKSPAAVPAQAVVPVSASADAGKAVDPQPTAGVSAGTLAAPLPAGGPR
jgi:hypothetical protein